MKHEFRKGLGTVLLLAVLISGITTTAVLAANRSIIVDDGIQVTVNGTAFTPKDAKGNTVPVVAYDGTVYVPMRAIAEALGYSVSYDAATRTAAIGASGSSAAAAIPNDASYIGEAKAKAAALSHAGLKESEVTFVTVKLDREDGIVVYDVEFYTTGREYDYEINALTGVVVSYDYDAEFYSPPAQSSYIGETSARAIAQAKAPNASIVKIRLDTDDGRAKYELELREGLTEYECEIDAVTGNILSWEMD